MANRNTYVPTHTRVKARRIRKVMEVISATPLEHPDVEADRKFLDHKLRNYVLDRLGDNHTVEFYNDISEFKALEDKYIKAPKIALKGL